jgi:hypothetical protein
MFRGDRDPRGAIFWFSEPLSGERELAVVI